VKLSSPSTARNREPIAAVLAELLPASGLVLEVASGAGEHARFLAGRFPQLDWQPTDPDATALASIQAYVDEAALPNLRAPLLLDAAAESWPVDGADAILCINMVHISPCAATLGLLRGASRLLASGAPLLLYGPYRRAGVETAPSNEAFDRSLRSRNPAWGLRTVEAVTEAAAAENLLFEQLVEMPANNLILAYRRR
jgi:hypothetical protein